MIENKRRQKGSMVWGAALYKVMRESLLVDIYESEIGAEP